MAGETDLGTLLQSLDVRQREGTYVYVNLPPGTPLPDLPLSAVVTEVEGTTIVLRQSDAEEAGMDTEFPSAWLTLAVHSSLEAVGLTASVSAALAVVGIPCNIIAGFHHDHLLVPPNRAEDAIAAIAALRDRPELHDS